MEKKKCSPFRACKNNLERPVYTLKNANEVKQVSKKALPRVLKRKEDRWLVFVVLR